VKGALSKIRQYVCNADLLVRRLVGSRAAQMHYEFDRLRRCGDREATTTILGRPLRLSQACYFEPMYRDIFEREIYKFEAVGSSPRIIDCGAHVGMASIYLGLRHKDARITAIEADPRIAAIARANLDSFDLHQIEVVAAAVTNYDGVATFTGTGDLAGRIGSVQGLETQSQLTVPAVRLSPYLDEPVEFLKIDIEGAETDVLTSIAGQLHNVRLLFVEYHGFAEDAQTLSEFLGILSRSGFRYYVTSAYDFRRCPFKDQNCNVGMDLQLNVFCVREDS